MFWDGWVRAFVVGASVVLLESYTLLEEAIVIL